MKISAPSSRPFGLQQVTHAPTGGGGQTDRMTDRQTDRQTDIVQIVLIDKRFPLASLRYIRCSMIYMCLVVFIECDRLID